MSGESSSLKGGSKPSYAAIASGADEEIGHGHSHSANGTGAHSHSAHGHSHGGRSPDVRMSPRSAYARGDAEASKRAHDAKKGDTTHHKEGHSDSGEYIKSIVYGGLDGIITTFATVTSVAGADFSAAVIVVLGISHLFADGLSMGMGDYLSSEAEIDYTASERKREAWEMEVNMSQDYKQARNSGHAGRKASVGSAAYVRVTSD